MARYALFIGHYRKETYKGSMSMLPSDSNKPFATTDSIKDARVKAVRYLMKINKKGWYVFISDLKDYEKSEGVSIVGDTLMGGIYEYNLRPSEGLKLGYKFTSFDGGKSRIINKDGSLGKIASW